MKYHVFWSDNFNIERMDFNTKEEAFQYVERIATENKYVNANKINIVYGEFVPINLSEQRIIKVEEIS